MSNLKVWESQTTKWGYEQPQSMGTSNNEMGSMSNLKVWGLQTTKWGYEQPQSVGTSNNEMGSMSNLKMWGLQTTKWGVWTTSKCGDFKVWGWASLGAIPVYNCLSPSESIQGTHINVRLIYYGFIPQYPCIALCVSTYSWQFNKLVLFCCV